MSWYLYDVPVLNTIVNGYHTGIDSCAYHLIAHRGVGTILSKVNGCKILSADWIPPGVKGVHLA